jgi:predicted Zn finger-like uncharacterized protein
MTLATRCPRCGTVYRLVADQLQLHHGLVRCGHCQEIFDGTKYAVAPPVLTDVASTPDASPRASEDAGQAPAPAVSAAPAAGPDAPAAVGQPVENIETWAGRREALKIAEASAAASATSSVSPSAPGAGPDYAASPAGDAWVPAPGSRVEPSLHLPETASDESRRGDRLAAQRAATGPTATAAAGGTGAAVGARSGTGGAVGAGAGAGGARSGAGVPPADGPSASSVLRTSTPAARADNFAITREAPSHTDGGAVRAFGWVIAFLLTLALIAQLAWWQRETVITLWPATRPLYASACAQFGCVMTPPRDIDGLAIQNTSLRQVDGPHHLELRFYLRNRDAVALAYPAVELTLLDSQNQIAARRVLWPNEYLAPGTPPQNGVPASSTLPVATRLDTGQLDAANYRVQIFYP